MNPGALFADAADSVGVVKSGELLSMPAYFAGGTSRGKDAGGRGRDAPAATEPASQAFDFAGSTKTKLTCMFERPRDASLGLLLYCTYLWTGSRVCKISCKLRSAPAITSSEAP